MNKKVRLKIKIIIFILFLIALICVGLWIYYLSESGKYHYLKKSYYITREIDTPIKLWFSGYLGIFFRVKYFGLLNWLMLPILIYFLFTFEKRTRWQIALFFVYVLSAILLGLKGFINYRYAYSLFPFTVAAILMFIWDIIGKFSIRCRFIVISMLMGLIAYSFNVNSDLYKLYGYLLMQRQTKNYLDNTIKYINKLDINGNNKIYVLNIMDFFYFTDKKAIKIGYQKHSKQKKYYNYLYNHKIKYILIDNRTLSSTYAALRDVLIYGAKMLVADDCYALYELIPWNSDIHEKPDYKGNFAEWKDPQKIRNTAKEFNNIIPHLIIIGVRGEYDIFKSDKDIIRISLVKSHEIDENVFAIGYSLGPDGLNLDVKPNDVVIFEIKARISSPSSANIFIQDFNGKWERNSIAIKKNSWDTYGIAKLIRVNSSKITVGIDYGSKSKDAFIEIQSPKIYIKRNVY